MTGRGSARWSPGHECHSLPVAVALVVAGGTETQQAASGSGCGSGSGTVATCALVTDSEPEAERHSSGSVLTEQVTVFSLLKAGQLTESDFEAATTSSIWFDVLKVQRAATLASAIGRWSEGRPSAFLHHAQCYSGCPSTLDLAERSRSRTRDQSVGHVPRPTRQSER